MNDKLTALYYPYSRCTDETALKRLILLYDEVWFIDPVPSRMRQELMVNSYVPEDIVDDWKVVREQYSILEESGAIRFFDPVPLITSHDTVLTASIESDVMDDALWDIFTRADLPDSWSILKERVPASTLNLFQESVAPGYIGYVKDQARYAQGKPFEQLVWSDWLPPDLAERLPNRPRVDRNNPQDVLGIHHTSQEIFDAAFRWIQSDTEISYKINSGHYRKTPRIGFSPSTHLI